MAQAWEPMLDELAAQRRGRLLAFATMIAGASSADDLVQEAVIATFSRNRGFTSVGQAERYVRRAIATRYVDSVRREQAGKRAERRAADRDVAPDALAGVDSGSAVDTTLALLPPRVRACIVLRFVEDLSVRETAAQLGLSEGAVKRYVSDGLALLNQRLGTSETLADGDRTSVSHPDGGAR